MKRAVWRAISTSAARRKHAQIPDTSHQSLSQRLKSSSDDLIAPAEQLLSRSQGKSKDVLRALAPDTPPQRVNGQPGWKPEEWKDSWGPDTLTPKKESKRQKPPHIPEQGKDPPSKKAKKRAYVPPKPQIEGLIDPSDEPILQDLAPTSPHSPIATLAHGLERVLFNPGVHWLQDPRSRVYNFSPHLENIPKVTDFAFERLTGFIKSSRDEDLRGLAKRENRAFAGSTSSLTGMLGHIYFLISEHKPVDISTLSEPFQSEDKNFTPGQRMPTSVLFNYKDGVYAIDSDGEDSSKNVLTWLGTLLEKFLTMSQSEFNTYLRSSPPPEKEEDPMREAYRYAKSEKFVMRSQLDCVDRRLPGTGVFDVKTRACLPIRMDILNWEENSGYVIKKAQGLYESFEREYYDLIRSAFLKYGFQVRIGNMDGVIVAYHNAARLFGFQYVSLAEMDQRLYGNEPGAGDRVFQKCVGLLECIAPEIVKCFPEQSVKCTFECEEGSRELNVWVQPAEWTPTDKEREPPIRRLAVRVQSFLNDSPVSGIRAINSAPTVPWTLHWSLTNHSQNQPSIRKSFEKCMERKFRAYSLPTGVSFEDLPQYWSELNFGGVPTPPQEADDAAQPPSAEEFDFSRFQEPNGRVQVLRDYARRGREFSERMELADAGRKKIVLGEPFDISDVEIEAYKTEEDRGVLEQGEDASQAQDLPTEELVPVEEAVESSNSSRTDEVDREPVR